MKTNEPMVHYIFTRMAHHSLHSGYDQITRYVPCVVAKPNGLYRFLDLWPERVMAQLRRTAGPWYNSFALKQELQIIPDIIFGSGQIFHFLYGEDGYRYAGYWNLKKSNRILATFHMPPEKFLSITHGTAHLKRLDAAVVVAPNQLKLFKSIIGREKVHLVPCGVDTSFFYPVNTVSVQGRTCLFVGAHLRDFSMLRQVIQRVSEMDGSIQFTVVTFREYFELFQALNRVNLHTAVSELQLLELYQSSSLLLLPLIDSTANLTVLEAMACGLPVVSTRVGGLNMYCHDKCAILVERGDVEGMVNAVLEIMDNSKLRASLSAEARKRAKVFDWEIIAEKMKTLYRRLQ